MTPPTHDENAHLLEQVSLFKGIRGNTVALNEIEKRMSVKKYPRQHVLIEQGHEGHEFFVLVSGQVSILKKTSEGDLYKVAVLTAEQRAAFGEGGLIEGEARSATVICETDVECLILTRQHFNDFSQKHPEFALPILKQIAINLMNRLNQTSQDLMLLHNALMSEIRSG